MNHLISNELNERAIINNILSKSLNRLILISGVFGTGKSVFAEQIARMITCDNLTKDGYCGKCESCTTEVSYGVNSFSSRINILNMETIDYEKMQMVVNDAVNKFRRRDEVFVFDEFHSLEKKSQEIWLAETQKLENCYIIMTTTDKRSISDGIISRSIQLGMKQLTPLESAVLIKEHYPEANQEIVSAIVKKIGGSPRDLIVNAQFYANAGLSVKEMKHHLSNVNQEELIICLESMHDRKQFFQTLKTVRSMNHYSVKRALQDLLWDWLSATMIERETMYHLAKFNEQDIMRFLIMSNDDPFLTILKMFTKASPVPNIKSEPIHYGGQEKIAEAESKVQQPNVTKVNRW